MNANARSSIIELMQEYCDWGKGRIPLEKMAWHELSSNILVITRTDPPVGTKQKLLALDLELSLALSRGPGVSVIALVRTGRRERPTESTICIKHR